MVVSLTQNPLDQLISEMVKRSKAETTSLRVQGLLLTGQDCEVDCEFGDPTGI